MRKGSVWILVLGALTLVLAMAWRGVFVPWQSSRSSELPHGPRVAFAESMGVGAAARLEAGRPHGNEELEVRMAQLAGRRVLGPEEVTNLRGILNEPLSPELCLDWSRWDEALRERWARMLRSSLNKAVLSILGDVLLNESPGPELVALIRQVFMQELSATDPAAREAAVLSLWEAGLLDEPLFYAQAAKLMGDADARVANWAKLKLAQWSQFRVQWYSVRKREAPIVHHLPKPESR